MADLLLAVLFATSICYCQCDPVWSSTNNQTVTGSSLLSLHPASEVAREHRRTKHATRFHSSPATHVRSMVQMHKFVNLRDEIAEYAARTVEEWCG